MGTEVAGLAFAMVVGAGMMLKFILHRLAKLEDAYRELATNHIAHSTQAMVDMTRVAEEVLEELKRR